MPVNVVSALEQALRELEAEKSRIERQIEAVRTALDGVGRRAAAAPRTARRSRRRMSAAARRAASQRMKAYWAKRRGGGAAVNGKGGATPAPARAGSRRPARKEK
jgi:hypothetical protein